MKTEENLDVRRHRDIEEIVQFESETSDEEDVLNTVGQIPLDWYKNYDHIGYDIEGKEIKQFEKTNIDSLVDRVGNPDAWKTVEDIYNGREIVLDNDIIQTIKNIVRNKSADGTVTRENMISQIHINESEIDERHRTTRIENASKNSSESHFIKRILRSMIRRKLQPAPNSLKKSSNSFYDIWSQPFELTNYLKKRKRLPPPKSFIPGHCESYNPPEEYLLNEKEIEDWKARRPHMLAFSCIPAKFDTLRAVPNTEDYMQSLSDRCVNLYSAPRVKVTKYNLESKDLVPTINIPDDTDPYPTEEKLVYFGHQSQIKSASIHPNGLWLATCSSDKTVRIWNIITGRCLETIETNGAVTSVQWLPNIFASIVSFTCQKSLFIKEVKLSNNFEFDRHNREALSSLEGVESIEPSKCEWNVTAEQGKIFQIEIVHPEHLLNHKWHNKSNYITTVLFKPQKTPAVLVHQLSKRQSQLPFKKLSGTVLNAYFHPNKPIFYIVSTESLKVFDLSTMSFVRKFQFAHRASSSSLHWNGEHIIIGCDNGKVFWYDLEITSKPIKTLNYHKSTVNDIYFHTDKKLFASCSDDGSIVISHFKIFDKDLNEPEVMPLKKLYGHAKKSSNSGVTCCNFTQNMSFLISGGNDGLSRLYA